MFLSPDQVLPKQKEVSGKVKTELLSFSPQKNFYMLWDLECPFSNGFECGHQSSVTL